MRGLSSSVAVVLMLAVSGCALGPTEQEIADSLERALRSVSGDWHGASFGANAMALDLRLHEDSNGNVTGTGTMTESGAGSVVPITVSGTYRRPVLALTFIGLQYEAERVQGSLEGEYTSVGGISTTLFLTGPGSSKAVAILLQEE